MKYLLAAFYLLLKSSGFRLLVLLFWLLHSEKLLVDSLGDCKRRLVDSHVLDVHGSNLKINEMMSLEETK